MARSLAFDVYGTLIDPLGVAAALRAHIGERASAFARAWREKQLEYLFRRALMREYRDFPTCTREALVFTDRRFGTGLPAATLDALTGCYLELPAYPDAAPALDLLRTGRHRAFAFSNGLPADLERLLKHAGLAGRLDGIVSVHDVASYKPDPAVYRHFLETTGSTAAGTWLISGNPFDVIGARAAGWHAAWVRRDATAVYDPWGIEPSVTIADLRELPGALQD